MDHLPLDRDGVVLGAVGVRRTEKGRTEVTFSFLGVNYAHSFARNLQCFVI